MQNKEEYVLDPNIFIQADGDVKYITDSLERKRVTYEYEPGSKFMIEESDKYDGSWGGSLSRARKMASSNKFPVFVVPWDDNKQFFKTKSLDDFESVRNVINESQFSPVRVFLA